MHSGKLENYVVPIHIIYVLVWQTLCLKLGARPVRASEGSSQLVVFPYEHQWAIAHANTVIFDLTSITSRDIVTAAFLQVPKRSKKWVSDAEADQILGSQCLPSKPGLCWSKHVEEACRKPQFEDCRTVQEAKWRQMKHMHFWAQLIFRVKGIQEAQHVSVSKAGVKLVHQQIENAWKQQFAKQHKATILFVTHHMCVGFRPWPTKQRRTRQRQIVRWRMQTHCFNPRVTSYHPGLMTCQEQPCLCEAY